MTLRQGDDDCFGVVPNAFIKPINFLSGSTVAQPPMIAEDILLDALEKKGGRPVPRAAGNAVVAAVAKALGSEANTHEAIGWAAQAAEGLLSVPLGRRASVTSS